MWLRFLLPKRKRQEFRCGNCLEYFSITWQLNSRMPINKQLKPSKDGLYCPCCNQWLRTPWQDEDRTITTVEQVYETRWDCMAVPG